MKSLFGALVVLGLSIALLARAEPPPAMERRELSKIIAALKTKPGAKAALASVRFYAEVLGAKELQAPVGSTLDTLGPWSDDGALLGAEQLIDRAACGPLAPAELKVASALLTEYGDVLSPTLRAYTLGQQGKTAEASDGFAAFIDAQTPGGGCPGEHPMYSYRRVARIGFALRCVKAFSPARDVSKLEKALKRAEQCAKNNTAVG